MSTGSTKRRARRYHQKPRKMEKNLKNVGILTDRDELSFPISLSDAADRTHKEVRNDFSQFSVEFTSMSDANKDSLSKDRKKDNDTEKFRQSLKYHDKESYVSQRDHKIGIGLFNTDEIEDLPPRHKKKVLKIYGDLQTYQMELEKQAETIRSMKLEKQVEAICPLVPPPPGFFDPRIDQDHKKRNFHPQSINKNTCSPEQDPRTEKDYERRTFLSQPTNKNTCSPEQVSRIDQDHKKRTFPSQSTNKNTRFPEQDPRAEKDHKKRTFHSRPTSKNTCSSEQVPRINQDHKKITFPSQSTNKNTRFPEQDPREERDHKKRNFPSQPTSKNTCSPERNPRNDQDHKKRTFHSQSTNKNTCSPEKDPGTAKDHKKRTFPSQPTNKNDCSPEQNYRIDHYHKERNFPAQSTNKNNYSPEQDPRSKKDHKQRTFSSQLTNKKTFLPEQDLRTDQNHKKGVFHSQSTNKNTFSPEQDSRIEKDHKKRTFHSQSTNRNICPLEQDLRIDKDNKKRVFHSQSTNNNTCSSEQDHTITLFHSQSRNKDTCFPEQGPRTDQYHKNRIFYPQLTNRNTCSLEQDPGIDKGKKKRFFHEQSTNNNICSPEQDSRFDQDQTKRILHSQSLNKITCSPQQDVSNFNSESSRDIRKALGVEANEEKIDAKKIPKIKENGFFLHISVSEQTNNTDMWEMFLKNNLKCDNFEVLKCCDFTESLILSFKTIKDASKVRYSIYKLKHRTKDVSKPHIKSLSMVKRQLTKPCMCEYDFIEHCDKYLEDFAHKYIATHKAKTDIIIDEMNSLRTSKSCNVSKEQQVSLKDAFDTLRAMETVFQNYVKNAKELAKHCSMPDLKKLKLDFSRECNSFERGLPIYSQKDVILNTIKNYPVSIIIAETGSGKSTQLTQYLLQTTFAYNGSIICTQPRKIAAISITKFVSTQMGSSVGREVGFDVGIEKKFDQSTKIIYMTDYALLRKCLRNKNLKGVSCVIIDEAHERTLYTDLLLGLLKQCLACRQDLRIIITSATINPSVFVEYFNLPDGAVINVPGRAYPVKVIWSELDVSEGFRYVTECVEVAVKVHLKESNGDILVFLSSPAEIDEAILLFEDMCPKENMPELMSLHGKSDIKDQMLVFETSTNNKRRVIFATNAAETSLTIPGIRYVIDSGMAKEMIFYPEKNKSCLMPTLINKSSAEQRKGRAGRTRPGVCYRLYSKKNYESMPERALPELLKTDLLNALLKVYEFGIKPNSFDFVESPSKEAIARSIDSLEVLELVENNELTELGQQVVKLSIEPRLAKFILLGVNAGMGHEAAIIAALVSEAGRIFLRFDDNKEVADKKKRVFCQRSGDLCTFLEIYKRWLEVSQTNRFDWCVSNYVSSKALVSASKTVKEILITLRLELGINVSRRYNNLSFKNNFETILFKCFVENLCVYSGHPSLGYQSPNFKESLFIHPSSSLKYLRIEPPKFLVYTVFMETTRNYILDVTPLKEETVNKAFLKGNYALSVDNLKQLQIPPLTLGPFGEKVLSRHILGKGGSVINNIEYLLEKLTKNKNFRIDICRDKGLVIIHVEEKFHKKVSNFIHDIVDEARKEMAKETDVIKMDEGFSYYCLSAGGLIHDVIMPEEFREITIEPIDKNIISEFESGLKKFGSIETLEVNKSKFNKYCINVTYFTVADAQNALRCLKENNVRGVRVRNIVPKVNKSSKPLYKLKFRWSRLLSKGTGSIFFSSEEDLAMVSGKLSTKSLYIDNNHILITPSQNGNSLNLKNLPQSATEGLIQEKISEVLPDFLMDLVKGVEINRVETSPVVESDIMKLKDQLFESLCRFTPPSKVVVDIVHPVATSQNYEAFAYFECVENGKTAFQQLKNKLKLNNLPVSILELLQSRVKCKKHVYDFLKKDIQGVMKQQDGKIYAIDSISNKDEVIIKFSSGSIENLYIIIKEILRLVHGRRVECRGNKKYFYLFTESGKQILDRIQTRTKTLIECDTDKKIVFIYGQNVKKCCMAQAEIHSFIENSKLLKTKIYDLKSSDIPEGFLKELYSKYGWDLYGLIRKFDLKAANVDMKFGNLTIEGEIARLKKVDEHLEEICAKLYSNKTKKGDDDDDVGFGRCAICLDPVKFDYYRLENCGHSFCKSCLLLQMESKIIPVACAQENCGKPFFLIDINKILSLGGEKLRSEFQNAALQYHVRSHSGQISYCHTPDCSTVYRVSSKSDVNFHCPGCSNDICAFCRTFSHKGMNCDIFQNSKTDVDYSLKIWMKENESSRKQCPKCKVGIEKIEGCNHMECANCKSHLCWLCLEIFDSGDLVYDHLPYCPNNQSR